MPALAVIPARLGATRLPRKPLRLLGGLPLIVRVWQRVRAMHAVTDVVVATDSDDIALAVRTAGGRVMLTRSEHPSGTDRVAEVAAHTDFAAYETIVNVQGDEPFLPESAIRGALAMVDASRFPLGTAAAHAPTSILDDPDVVKVVCADDGRALYFSRAPIPWLRDAGGDGEGGRADGRRGDRPTRDALVRQHLGVYAYTRDALATWVALPPHPLERSERLEQLRPLAAGLAIGVATIDETPPGGVDTEADLTRANALWDDLYAGRT